MGGAGSASRGEGFLGEMAGMETEISKIAFLAFAGLLGVGMVALLISATRLCYRIEALSGRPFMKKGLPGYANVIPVAFNFGVAKDGETQALRRRMNARLLAIPGGFILLYLSRWAAGV